MGRLILAPEWGRLRKQRRCEMACKCTSSGDSSRSLLSYSILRPPPPPPNPSATAPHVRLEPPGQKGKGEGDGEGAGLSGFVTATFYSGSSEELTLWAMRSNTHRLLARDHRKHMIRNESESWSWQQAADS